MEFPIYKTKIPGINKTFDLNTPIGRHKYFRAKAGQEIENIKNYLDTNTFVGFLLAKKGAGKGTYSKMVQELVGENRVELISVGDLVRETHQIITENGNGKKELMNYLEKVYRGFIPFNEAVSAFINKSQEKLIPTEFILTLIRSKISSAKNKAIFLDGFPRQMDQISYSLFFRQIMNLRDDPDFFTLIDVPMSIIDARIKTRVVCPICLASRNTKLLPTQFLKYDKDKKSVILLCDNQLCDGRGKQAMGEREYDKMGISLIRERLKTDGRLIETALSLHGIPKVLVRNAIPVEEKESFDSYELTQEYYYDVDHKTGKIKIKKKPFVVDDDNGRKSYSLLAAPAVLSMIMQIHKILGLDQK